MMAAVVTGFHVVFGSVCLVAGIAVAARPRRVRLLRMAGFLWIVIGLLVLMFGLARL